MLDQVEYDAIADPQALPASAVDIRRTDGRRATTVDVDRTDAPLGVEPRHDSVLHGHSPLQAVRGALDLVIVAHSATMVRYAVARRAGKRHGRICPSGRCGVGDPESAGQGAPVEPQARGGGRRAALTRQGVLTEALRIVDTEGVEALTMRRLARALDRDPMRLYRFAANKEALLDGVVEQVLDELEVPHRAGARWEDTLRTTAHAFRRIALAHPHVVPLMVTRPLATPLALRPIGTLRPLEALLELFVGAGFDPRGALYAYRLFMGFLQGHVLNELQENVHDPDETDDLLRLGLNRLPLREFPRLRSLAAELAAYDGAQELDEGLDVILAGLRRQLDPRRPPGRPRSRNPSKPPRHPPTAIKQGP